MERLNKQLLKKIDLPSHLALPKHTEHPPKILQFGEGNFLRGFVDWMVHQLNQKGLFDGSILAVQPTPHGKTVTKLHDQDGLYTVVLRGIENGETIDTRELISSISQGINPYTDWKHVLQAASNPEIQLVFSNTTEVGLNYKYEDYNPAQFNQSPSSFPGILTACLYHRYLAFQGAFDAGWSIIPCELIEDNGVVLRNTVLRIAEDWKLGEDFQNWVLNHNRFYTTLVDRIVTGYPKDTIDSFQQELGYEDQLMTVGEPYHLFVIDGDPLIQELIPFHKAGLNVHWTDVTEFRELKVKILNGAHTLMAAAGYLAGKQTVLEVMQDPEFKTFVTNAIYQEILPVLADDEVKKNKFAESVLDRFQNPFNPHYLLDISLNSISKFKVRLLPSLKTFIKQTGKLPSIIPYSLASLLVFYKGNRLKEGFLVGKRGPEEYLIRDSEDILRFFYETWSSSKDPAGIVETFLENKTCWGENLNEIRGLTERVTGHVTDILNRGIHLKFEE